MSVACAFGWATGSVALVAMTTGRGVMMRSALAEGALPINTNTDSQSIQLRIIDR